MKHVRLAITANGREAAIHPMYGVLTSAAFVERSTALQWNATGEELGILHHVVGDIDAFESAAREIEQVIDFELEPAGEGAFYAYIHDELTPASRAMFDHVSYGGLVVVPPMVYHEDGHVSISAFGPADVIQAAIDSLPDTIEVTVRAVGGLTGLPQVTESYLSDRQQAALSAAFELGYYDVPRTASQDDVATELDCAPSTAAEHLRKAEKKVVESVLATR